MAVSRDQAVKITPAGRQRIRSQCQKCTREVRWFTYSSAGHAGFQDPMDEAGLAWVALSNGMAVQTMTFTPHECPGVRPLDPHTGEYVLTRSEMLAINNERAMEHQCPKCHAKPQEPCVNLLHSKSPKPTKWPHVERVNIVVPPYWIEESDWTGGGVV